MSLRARPVLIYIGIILRIIGSYKNKNNARIISMILHSYVILIIISSVLSAFYLIWKVLRST